MTSYKIQDFMHSKAIKYFLKSLSILSLLISNVILLSIFRLFFTFNSYTIFLVMFALSLIILRTNYILAFNGRRKNSEEQEPTKKYKERSKSGLYNISVVLTKTLFFNILNDLFILTILWVFLLSGLWFLGLLTTSIWFDFTQFVSVVTLISILSGFYQFYIKNYKEQVTQKIVDTISQYIVKTLREINFKDFMIFVSKRPENADIFRRINKIILGEEKIKDSKHIMGTIPINQINLAFKIEPSYLFDFLDYYKEFREDSKNKIALKKLYEEYFADKLEKFKKELAKEDLSDIKKLLYSGLVFFDEVEADLQKSLFEYSYPGKEDMEDFRDFYEKFMDDCIFYLADDVLNLNSLERV